MEIKFGRMGPKIITNEEGIMNHPYEDFENSQAWKILDAAVKALVKNKDIIETTRHELIVGYLCKQIWPECSGKGEKADT